MREVAWGGGVELKALIPQNRNGRINMERRKYYIVWIENVLGIYNFLSNFGD